ncbi:kin of IRRE-like protein 2 isoform X1 [Haliotis rufescens]|uniref:kin of IRRE-like protein 2 isoform X1 n=1 Tax=Haliotis rufescens TaxID=6454 RepID=UPI00201F5C1E|nr:kin of IRRE-like protein 2 isoform X1 [Haliotis rufescens]
MSISDMEYRVDVLLLISFISETITAIGIDYNWSTPVPLPSFFPSPTNFTYTEGDLARLECAINNLSTKKVIWRKGSDPNPLTIGKRTFVDDKRVIIEHTPLHRNWNLLIKRIQLDDEGMYECQVSSKARHLRHHVYLTVLPSETPIKHKPDDVPKTHNGSGLIYDIRISGEKYVEKGQMINLTCNATGEEHPPDDLDWFKNGDKLSSSITDQIAIQKRVSLTTRTIVSILQISNAGMNDAGVYICRTSDLQITSARVNVLNAHTYNVKRHEKDKNKATSAASGGSQLDNGARPNTAHSVSVVLTSAIFMFLNNVT